MKTSRWTVATWLFVAAVTVVALTTLRQFGATWDEEHSMEQGERVLAWYTSGFTDRRVIDEGNYRFYGGFFNVLVQFVHRATGSGLYETSHFFSMLFGLGGITIAAWIGSALFSPAAGLLAAVFLCLTPVYYGHSFNNPKDLPFAVLSLLSVAAMMACWPKLPRLPRRAWLGTGIAFGLTIGIRIAGAIELGYLGLSWIAWWARSRRVEDLQTLVVSGLKVGVIAWLVGVAFWPYLQASPVEGVWQSFLASIHFGDWIATIRFDGRDVLSNHLPRSYVPLWFAVTLPEFYFVAAVACLLALGLTWSRRGSQPTGDARRPVFITILAMSIVMPVGSAIFSHPILYDGIRHLLFVVPPAAILAAIGVSACFAWSRHTVARLALGGLVAASLASTCVDMVRLHPYESIYFNRSVAGGLPGAYLRFETDYWGQSYKEGVDWLVANYRPQGTQPIRVANCSIPFLTGYYLAKTAELRARYVSVEDNDDPEVMLATTRWLCNQRIRGKVLHVVERMGTPLCYVIETRDELRRR